MKCFISMDTVYKIVQDTKKKTHATSLNFSFQEDGVHIGHDAHLKPCELPLYDCTQRCSIRIDETMIDIIMDQVECLNDDDKSEDYFTVGFNPEYNGFDIGQMRLTPEQLKQEQPKYTKKACDFLNNCADLEDIWKSTSTEKDVDFLARRFVHIAIPYVYLLHNQRRDKKKNYAAFVFHTESDWLRKVYDEIFAKTVHAIPQAHIEERADGSRIVVFPINAYKYVDIADFE